MGVVEELRLGDWGIGRPGSQESGAPEANMQGAVEVRTATRWSALHSNADRRWMAVWGRRDNGLRQQTRNDLPPSGQETTE